jgi:acyl-CoA synthetase (AMP-forming)/AMP-acid ligase II
MKTLPALWNEAEGKQPDKIAVIDADRRLSYRQLGERICRLTAGFTVRWKIRPGDIIALLAPNCLEFVISYFATVQAGAIVQPLDERLMPEEMKAILRDAGARFLIVHHSLWPKVESIRDGIPPAEGILGIGGAPDGVERFEAWVSQQPALPSRLTAVKPHDAAELMYTSGTTGEPKGVMRSHANVRAASRNSIQGFGYRRDDVIAITMPMSHSSALNSQMMPLIELGGTVVLLDRFDVKGLLEVIRAEHISCMRAVPAMTRLLLTSPDFCARELPSLRLLINSSDAIDPTTYRALKYRFATVQVLNSYGLTEASTCTVLPDSMALIRSDSIGTPIHGVEMRVMDEAGRTIHDQREGEIGVRGEHVFIGYHNRPQETQAVLRDDWLCTGDLGHRDMEGFYYLHGRKTEVISCGGRKFTPHEVERCILQLPEVTDVAVVGTAHRLLGQVVKAFVVRREPGAFDKKQVIQHCARNLASHKIPFYVEFVPEIPKSPVGKILRRKLQEQSYGR